MTDSEYKTDENKARGEAYVAKPDVLNILATMIAGWQHRHPQEHTGLLEHPTEAAMQWVHMQGEPHEDEMPTLEKSRQGLTYWKTPYLARVQYNLGMFLAMPYDQRVYIIAAHKAGIRWQGDNFELFKMIVQKIEDSRDGIDNGKG
jgi:hypothetical protein